MNCTNTYEAFADALQHLGQPEYDRVWLKYAEKNKLIYGNLQPYIYIGAVPWFYTELLMEFNKFSMQKLSFVVEWKSSWDEVYAEANEKHKSIMHYMSEYHGEDVDEITLKPAIYWMLDEKKAVFSEQIPDGEIIMALQIREWEPKNDNAQ